MNFSILQRPFSCSFLVPIAHFKGRHRRNRLCSRERRWQDRRPARITLPWLSYDIVPDRTICIWAPPLPGLAILIRYEAAQRLGRASDTVDQLAAKETVDWEQTGGDQGGLGLDKKPEEGEREDH